MKILALDSSGLVASAALTEDNVLIAEFTMNHKQTHSQTLLPMVEGLCRMAQQELSGIDAIAVAAGPGSFTGLRIGSATAKGIGFALQKPIVPVPTVDALAYGLYGCAQLVCPILDARRGQVYTGIYAFRRTEPSPGEEALQRSYEMETLYDQMAVSIEELAETLNGLGRETVFLGDGVPVFAERLKELLRVPFSFAPAHLNRQRAAAVAALGSVLFARGRTETAQQHSPVYLRLPQAERERLEAARKAETTPEAEAAAGMEAALQAVAATKGKAAAGVGAASSKAAIAPQAAAGTTASQAGAASSPSPSAG